MQASSSNTPKYEPPRYTCPNTILLQQQHHNQQQALHQQQYPIYSQKPQPPLPVPPPKPATITSSLKQNTPLLRTYMKPLPKLPTDIDESRDMSSTDDLSSRPHSPSMSSSDESYSKTTEGEGDGDEDSPRITAANNHLNRNGDSGNPLQWLYPCDIQVDPTSPVVDMSNLRDFEVSSTTESQGQHTTTTQNKGDSCNSFEYQDRNGANGASSKEKIQNCIAGTTTTSNSTKSPFERELQRLLNESSRARGVSASASTGGANQTTSGSLTNPEGNTTSNSSSRNNIELSYSVSSNNGLAAGGSGSNGNISNCNSNSGNNNGKPTNKYDATAMTILDDLTSPNGGNGRQSSKIPISTSFVISKHPVGLEAIKEITRNKNPSESSQM